MASPSNKGRFVHSIREELMGVVVFVAFVWLVTCVHWWLRDWTLWAELIPRYWTRLPAIVTMPLVHADLAHIISNTVPLLVLLVLLAGSRASSALIVAWITVISGSLLWLLGRNGSPQEPIAHVGASALIFGLVTFHVAAGFLERRIVPILLALLVGFLYGSHLISAIFFPILSTNDRASWEGHLFGAVAGVAVAWAWTRKIAPPLDDALPFFRRLSARAQWLLEGLRQEETADPD